MLLSMAVCKSDRITSIDRNLCFTESAELRRIGSRSDICASMTSFLTTGGPSGSGVCCGATIGVGSDGLGEIEIDAFCTAVAGADGIGTA